jgi:class 3 adenylate cyclase
MVFLFSFLAYLVWAYDIPVAEILMIFVPTLVAALVSRTVLTELQALRASRALEKYLSPELLENIVERGMAVDLSTKRRELTVLFVDIVGFSTVSENAEAEHVNLFLNDFFDRMTNAVFRHHGTIDKFLGDGLLAFFGDPVPLENHALAALRASLEMQEQMEAMNRLWASSGRGGLDQGIHIRIGANSGLVIVGNIGSSRRLEYTVLGSVVNIAGRLQSVAPPGGIIMTGTTWALARDHLDVECQGPEMIRARGIGKDIEVYTISPIAMAAKRSGIRS